MSRTKAANSSNRALLRVQLTNTVRDYLEAIAVRGLHGNEWTDVAAYLVRDGIERLIREGTIPRRKFDVPYETDEETPRE